MTSPRKDPKRRKRRAATRRSRKTTANSSATTRLHPTKPGRAVAERGSAAAGDTQVVRYQYTDKRANPLGPPKIRRPGKNLRWARKLTQDEKQRLDRHIYRLPEVRRAIKRGETIYVVDGEKDADRMWAEGLAATCCPYGSWNWKDAHSRWLKDADVAVIADKDPRKPKGKVSFKGQKAALRIVRSLQKFDVDATVLEAVQGKDASDHFNAGYTAEDLISNRADLTSLPYAQSTSGSAIWELIERRGKQKHGRDWRPVLRDQLTTSYKYLCLLHEPDAKELAGDPKAEFRVGENGRPLHSCFKCSPEGKSDTETRRAFLTELAEEVGITVPELLGHDETSGSDEADIDKEFRRLWLRDQAQDRLHAHKAAATFSEPPSTFSLEQELAIEDGPPAYTIDRLHQTGTNTLLAAQYKTGKTTLTANCLRSLIDGTPFLGHFDIGEIDGRVAFWNFEMTDAMFRSWLRDQGIENMDRGAVWNLRGYTLPLWTPHVQDIAVRWLEEREVSFLFIDPWRRAYSGFGGENANEDVGRWLDVLDLVKRRAGVQDLVMATHTGRMQHEEGQERARGATTLDDWADNRWILVKEKDGNRYFHANGRDVHVDEVKLNYEPASRKLTVGGGDRRSERLRSHSLEAYEIVKKKPGIKKSELLDRMKGKRDFQVQGVADAIARGYIETKMDGRAQLHYPKQDPRRLKMPRAKRKKKSK